MKKRVMRERGKLKLRRLTRSTGRAPREPLRRAQAAESQIRCVLLSGLEQWLAKSGMKQIDAARRLGVTQSRISDIKRGKINQRSLGLLIRLAARAGLQPRIRLTMREAGHH